MTELAPVLRDAQHWNVRPRAPADLFSPALRPSMTVPTLLRGRSLDSAEIWTGLRHICDEVGAKRRNLLAGSVRTARCSGRVLLYDPRGTMFDGLAAACTHVVDDADAPTWDSWLGVVDAVGARDLRPDDRFFRCVASWIPEWLIARADEARRVSPALALAWADDESIVPGDTARELLRLGLAP